MEMALTLCCGLSGNKLNCARQTPRMALILNLVTCARMLNPWTMVLGKWR